MKTAELVNLLATGEPAVQRHVAGRRYALAIGLGMVAAALLMKGLLGLRHDLGAALLLPMFWIKVGYVAGLVLASLLAVLRLSRPGSRLDWVTSALAAPILAMWALAALVLSDAGPGQRAELLLGQTWAVCPLLITLLSVPVFAGVTWAMRGLAPTRLRLAGAAAGLLSGSVGALVYCLHCPEMAAPFIGSWYLLGMLIPSVIGAVLGHRLLRW